VIDTPDITVVGQREAHVSSRPLTRPNEQEVPFFEKPIQSIGLRPTGLELWSGNSVPNHRENAQPHATER